MSHMKVLRGNLARQILSVSKRGKKQKCASLQFSDRSFATQTAPASTPKSLASPWGEIQVGNETLTEHVFKDISMWGDKPSVVSCLSFIQFVSKQCSQSYVPSQLVISFSTPLHYNATADPFSQSYTCFVVPSENIFSTYVFTITSTTLNILWMVF